MTTVDAVDPDMPRVTSGWLAVREPGDAAARSTGLVDLLRPRLAGGSLIVVHDLGCGTGSMGRWLAPLLAGRQHWIMYDRDPDLLRRAEAAMVDRAADGAPVTVETRQRDITRLTPGDLAGGGLVTASALLDLLTADEVDRVAVACAGAGCPALLTLSVAGTVELTPADPLDSYVAAAFNAHQRRDVNGRRLLGPDAVAATVDAFGRRGWATEVRSGPWRFGAGDGAVLAEWFDGWWGAAVEQDPGLAGSGYPQRRRAQLAAGELRAVIGHQDLLATGD
jgi:SAM-dependent methyltransferase